MGHWAESPSTMEMDQAVVHGRQGQFLRYLQVLLNSPARSSCSHSLERSYISPLLWKAAIDVLLMADSRLQSADPDYPLRYILQGPMQVVSTKKTPALIASRTSSRTSD